MNSLKLVFRRLFRKGENTFTRIVSLAVGLAFSILLLSEVFYFYSYDCFFTDIERIYVINEVYKADYSSDKLGSYPRVSGAIAPGMKKEVPGIEEATRLNSIGTSIFYTDDLKGYSAQFSLADEYLFEVLPRPVVGGNPKEILKTPMCCLVSSKIAEKIGGEVIGKIIELKNYPGKKLTVKGVFEELPENTNYKYDVLISMVSTGEFMWDGTDNWLGNDRYYALVKFEPGVNPKEVAPAVRKMQEKYQDIVKIEQANEGMVLKYSFEPLKKRYARGAKDKILILTIIALAALFVSSLNYILLTLSAMVNQAKSSAVYKTCGAQSWNLQKMIFVQTVVIFFIALMGTALIILLAKPFIENQLGHKLSSMLNPYVIVPIIGGIILIIILISIFPGKFFAKIPVASAFRDYKQKKNKWKLALLAFQFIGASFIFIILVIVTMQYDKMKNADHGYSTEGIYYGSTNGIDGRKISTVINELNAMPEVEKVGLGCKLPITTAFGNNVVDGDKDLFNVADFYWVDENYLSVLNIAVVEGQNFSKDKSVANDILLSRKGIEKLKVIFNWEDGALDKQIEITEHGNVNIKGVFNDFIINSISNPDKRPSVFFFMSHQGFIERKIENPSFKFFIVIKINELAQKGIMDKITAIFNKVIPAKDANIFSLQQQQEKLYFSEKGFRDAMIAGSCIVVLITLIGLIGYTTNEANRRSKELAVRRINGATMNNILRIFVLELEYIAIPAVIIGIIGGWFVAQRWMRNFIEKIPLNIEMFIMCFVIILIFIAAVAIVNYLKIANKNPVEALKTE